MQTPGRRDTKVAPRDRAGQWARRWPVASFRRSNGCLGPHPVWGQGFRATGSLPRVCEGSTDVRMVQERWRNCGLGRIGGEKWRRRGDEVGLGWGWMGQGRNGWGGRVTLFSSTGERMGPVWARGCGRSKRWGVRGDIGYAKWRTQGDGGRSRVGRGDRHMTCAFIPRHRAVRGNVPSPRVAAADFSSAGCSREKRFWSRLVI